MKKLFMLAAMVLGLASCQNEPEGLDVVVGGEQEVMLNVSLPESTRGTSATGFDFKDFESNTKYDLRFILEITHGGKTVRKVETTNTTSMTFPVRLAPNRDYTFTVWADLVEEGKDVDLYYNTEDLKNITFKSWTPNIEARDAYTMTMTKTFVAGTDLSMELTRPFAKVRVVATDIKNILDFGIKPTNAIVEYKSVLYKSFNAVEGCVNGTETEKKTHSFNYEDVDTYTDVEGQFTAFADYIFVPASGTVQFSLEIKQNNDTIKKSEFNTPIPVEKNKVTSIVGDVLTEGGNVSITVDSGLGQTETINFVNSAASLQKAIDDIPEGESGNIKLGGDVDLSENIGATIMAATRAEKQYGLIIPENKSVILDLNGKKIFQSKECTANYAMILNKGNLTIVDGSETPGKISFKDTGAGDPTYGWGTYTLRNEGTLVVENGVIEHLGQQEAHMICAIFQYSGSSTINGGTISTPAYRSARLWGGDMTINDGNFEGQLWLQAVNNTSSDLTINGGTFAPRGGDSSSVYVTNDKGDVTVAVTGGYFTTKIGMYQPFGCITGGIFTDAAKANTNEDLLNSDYRFVDNGNDTWSVAEKEPVAKIGDVEYKTLIQAAAAVQDGETITLVANERFTAKNYSDNGGWKDGLYYIGDKSFTIDLGGFTIDQDGALNDYLVNFKNVGSKANTITLKNGTLDAGTTAYCALCTSSTQENQLTINLENITLINNISNGSTVKVRGGSILNVNAGTKIIGKNSYLGIECVASTTNIYDGAELYMNGTGSYNGCLAGACGGGTINVYGGYGKGVKGGFIAMTSGGYINVKGGEWIANTDGSIGTNSNSNLCVLTAQSNKYESGFVCGAYINVTGGILRGGMDAWVLNNLAGEVAELKISGGNFNADPTRYVATGYEAIENDGNWVVESKGYYTDANGNYHINGVKGWLWMADQTDTFFRNKTIYLDNDLDFAGVDMRVTRMFTPELSATFDGQNHTVSNIWMASNYTENNQALFDGMMTVKNLNVENAQVYGMTAVGIIGANIYGTIENCHVKNSRAYGYVWQVGGIVGLHSWGEIKNCSVENTSIECYYYGAVGAIAGAMNEVSRKITDCTVKDCRLIKEGTAAEYASYDGLFGAFAGYLVASGNYEFSGVVENTTVTMNGATTDAKAYGEAEANTTVTYNGTTVVNSTSTLTAAISAGVSKIMLDEGIYVIPNSAAGKTLHFVGLGDPANTKIATNNETGSYEGCNYTLNGSTVTFENISINTSSTSYIGYAGCKATYKNCTINGFYCLYDNSTFEDCTFNVSGDTYNVWTWAAPVATFTRCTFNSDGKAMMLYGGVNTTLTVNYCVFNDNDGLVDELKAAIEVGNDYNMSYELIVNNTVVNGYAINNKGINTGTTLWANKNSMGQDKLNVIVDGVDVY